MYTNSGLRMGSRVQFLFCESEFVAYVLWTLRFVNVKTGGQKVWSAKLIQRLKTEDENLR